MSSSSKRVFQLHAELCKTLANPTRLELLSLLRNGEKSVNELAALSGCRQATVSQHLSVLRQKGVVSTRREGINIYYKVANPKVTKACEIIREVLFEYIDNMNGISMEEEAKVKT